MIYHLIPYNNPLIFSCGTIWLLPLCNASDAILVGIAENKHHNSPVLQNIWSHANGNLAVHGRHTTSCQMPKRPLHAFARLVAKCWSLKWGRPLTYLRLGPKNPFVLLYMDRWGRASGQMSTSCSPGEFRFMGVSHWSWHAWHVNCHNCPCCQVLSLGAAIISWSQESWIELWAINRAICWAKASKVHKDIRLCIDGIDAFSRPRIPPRSWPIYKQYPKSLLFFGGHEIDGYASQPSISLDWFKQFMKIDGFPVSPSSQPLCLELLLIMGFALQTTTIAFPKSPWFG